MFLRNQIEDRGSAKEVLEDNVTSIDLIYQLVNILTDVVDNLDRYLFSSRRVRKLIPDLLAAFIECLYGPCIDN